jgi:uncharacterized protein with PIN domain
VGYKQNIIMQNYFICSECNSPLPEANAHVINVKPFNINDEQNERLIYCDNCFKSVNAEFLKKRLSSTKPAKTTRRKKKDNGGVRIIRPFNNKKK